VSTLHLTASTTAIGARQCVHATPTPSASSVAVVAFERSPARWLDRWTTVVDHRPDRLTFVVDDATSWTAGNVEDRLRSVADTATDVDVRSVSSPGNLTELGVTLTAMFDSHDPATDVALCLQSLTVLLQYSPVEQVYQFLHTLITQVDRHGATAHFHLHDPAHDEGTVGTLRPLVDRILRDADR
jgi:hypothetical protein